MPPEVLVHVAPSDHPWAEHARAAVERGGGRLGGLAESEAVVWLDARADAVVDVLHDRIRWLQFRNAGVDALIDAGLIDDRRTFTAARGIYADGVAEHALALILASLGGLQHAARRSPSSVDTLAPRTLAGMTVAIVGAGGIGTTLAGLLRPFGPRIVGVTRTGRAVTGCDVSLSADRLEEVWPTADVVVLCAPATAATVGLVGRDVLRAMRTDALLVNVARGTLVDTDALVEALDRGWIGGAALDVTDPEPLPDDHPLWRQPRAIITPHSANPSGAQRGLLCELVTENVRRFLAGDELLGVVDPEAGY